jgi:hypothetical protein
MQLKSAERVLKIRLHRRPTEDSEVSACPHAHGHGHGRGRPIVRCLLTPFLFRERIDTVEGDDAARGDEDQQQRRGDEIDRRRETMTTSR